MAGPIGDGRFDELFGRLMATIANVNRGKRQKPYTAEQFRPKWDPSAPPERRREMTGEDMLREVKRINKGLGG